MQNQIVLLCAIAVSALLLGCKDKDLSAPNNPKMGSNMGQTISESANSTTPVSPVGTTPAGPTKEAAATTSSEKSDVSKADQSASMPLTGQANDHSAAVPKSTEFPKTTP